MPHIMARIKDYVEVINTLNTYESIVLSFFHVYFSYFIRKPRKLA